MLTQIKQLLATVEPFEAAALEQKVKAWVEEQKLQISQIVHPLRVALTGKGVGFGLFDTLAILGREQSISRIERAIARVLGALLGLLGVERSRAVLDFFG